MRHAARPPAASLAGPSLPYGNGPAFFHDMTLLCEDWLFLCQSAAAVWLQVWGL